MKLLVKGLVVSEAQLMRNLLALDQSSRTCGFAVFSDGDLLTYGHFYLKSDNHGKRLVQLREEIAKLIKDYMIDSVVFEDIQLQSNVPNNVATYKILAEVYGVVEEYVTEINLDNHSVLPVVWKSGLKIKGTRRAEQKKNAQKYVLETYGITATEDEADAICIGAHTVKTKISNEFDWS